MKNIIRKQKAVRNFVKAIDPSIKVKFGKYLECCPRENTIYVAFKSNEIDTFTFMEFVEELNPNNELNDLVLGILHEIGHLYTLPTKAKDREYSKQLAMLTTLNEIGGMDDYDMNRAYLRLEIERNATEWAVDFAEENENFCKKFQKRLDK